MDFLAQQGMHDPEWDAFVQAVTTRNRADRLQTARDIADIAATYRRHERHWREFEDAHGIARFHLGRKAESKFHPICRYVSGLGVSGDETGRASVMATVLDAWEKRGIAPAEILPWIAGTKGGMRAIYDEALHPIPGGVATKSGSSFSSYNGGKRCTISSQPYPSGLDRVLNKIVHGDCLSIMRQLPNGLIKGIVTSPPYNLRNSTGNGLKYGMGGKWPNAALIEGYDGHDDAMPHDQYVTWQRDCLNEMMRVLRPDGVIFYNHKWRVQAGLLQDRADIVDGFPVRQITSGNVAAASTPTLAISCQPMRSSI
jgi:DNA methylase